MAATVTVAQVAPLRKSSKFVPQQSNIISSPMRSRRGVVVLHGYGISVRVERGHLVMQSGVGSDRYKGRFARVGHDLERLVVVGADGVVSLSALRWLADQKASFVMLDRDGTVLATTGPVRPSDIKLRRAQALAHQTGLAFRMSRELIDRKLAGQERVARESLHDEQTATIIKQFRSELAEVESVDAIRLVEALAAKAYWKAWRGITITFPEKDMPRVPEHWRTFHSRISPLSPSPRLAANPVNAILNYLYAVLETECRLAIATLGLDPVMGVLHMDTINRDSFACDLMEPLRANVDEYVVSWIGRQLLKRNWFFEERNGNCRLMADLTSLLAETASTWARQVAPLAEWAAKEIASTTRTKTTIPATRLTQNHKRALTGSIPKSERSVRLKNMCSVCGKDVPDKSEKCRSCATPDSVQYLTQIAQRGRVVSHTSEAEAKRSKTQQANRARQREWASSEQPSWLTTEFYANKIEPLVKSLSARAVARHLSISHGYATEICNGRVPHPRHWQALLRMTTLPI
jgi:CRISPR-associated endonuclease Cas1